MPSGIIFIYGTDIQQALSVSNQHCPLKISFPEGWLRPEQRQ